MHFDHFRSCLFRLHNCISAWQSEDHFFFVCINANFASEDSHLSSLSSGFVCVVFRGFYFSLGFQRLHRSKLNMLISKFQFQIPVKNQRGLLLRRRRDAAGTGRRVQVDAARRGGLRLRLRRPLGAHARASAGLQICRGAVPKCVNLRSH